MSEARPPWVLDSARVLAYAIVDATVGFTGRRQIYADGALLGPVSRLAICQSLGEPEDFLLCHCDEDWNVLAVTRSTSLEVARQVAERNYPGIGDRWIELNVSREQALAYLDSIPDAIRCSFCGKRAFEVAAVIQSDHASICRGCVLEFADSFRENE